MGFDKLELSTETIRDLTAEELAGVAGGIRETVKCTTGLTTQSPVCPSGATWLMACDTYASCDA